MRTEKELAEALKQKQDTIIIEGDLKRKVFRIMATGKLAWGMAAGAIAALVISVLSVPATAGTSAPIIVSVGLTGSTVAAGILGGSTSTAAILVALAGGGIQVLNELRWDYKIVENTSTRIVLERR